MKTERFIKAIVLLIISFVIVQNINCQQLKNTDLEKKLTKVLNEIRNNKKENYLPSCESFYSYDPIILMNSIKQYSNDQNKQVRLFVQNIIYSVSILSNDLLIRKEAVDFLVNNCLDTEPLIWQQASQRLLKYRLFDFTNESKDKIRELLAQIPLRRETVLIAGVAQLFDQTTIFKKIIADSLTIGSFLNSGKWYGTVRWASHLALARMGSKDDILFCINKVEKENDMVIRVTRLLNDLAYIGQKEIVEILKKYIESNEKLPPVKDNVEGTGYNQYAMDLMTKMIMNFPVEIKSVGCYTQQDIDKGIIFLKNEKEYDFKR